MSGVQDLYQILEVKRHSNASEIKKSYYKLARTWHPDKHTEPSKKAKAEEKFKEVTEAYEILSDPEQRKIYDRHGLEGLKKQQRSGGGHPFPPFSFFEEAFGGSNPFFHHQRSRTPRQKHIEEVPLKTFYHGGTLKFTKVLKVPCESCKVFYQMQTCPQCQGQGICIQMQRIGPGFQIQKPVPCPKCQGQGQMLNPQAKKKLCNQKCEKGLISQPQTIECEIKPGENYGSRLLQNQGDFLKSPNKRADLELELRPPNDMNFQRYQGSDLIREEIITLGEALLGFDYHIEHVDGLRKIRLHSTQVIRPGTIKCLENEGLPILGRNQEHQKYGDLYILFDVKFPDKVSPKTREILSPIMNRRQNITPPPKNNPERLVVTDLDELSDSKHPIPGKKPGSNFYHESNSEKSNNIQCTQQ